MSSAALAAPRLPVRDATDAELVARVASDDLSALGALFDRHHARVARVLRHAGVGAADRDDIVQRTFLELIRTARTYNGGDSCGAYLCGIALRLARRQRRSLGRLLRMLASFGNTSPKAHAAMTPESEVAHREELARFAAALDELGPRKREAFVLVELEGLSAEEVGRALDVSPATIRTRLFYARAELRASMERP